MKKKRASGTHEQKASVDKGKRGANPKSSGTTFKPQPGTTYVKLVVPDFAEGFEHWLDDPDGNKVKVNCQDPVDRRSQKCLVCKAATRDNSIQTNHRYYFAVVVGKPKKIGSKKMVVFSPEVEVMETGTKIGSVICTYASEIIEDIDGEWEEQGARSITDVVIKITRKGEGIGTQYETRIANVKYKIDGDIGDVPDFQSLIKPATNSAVATVLGIDREDDDEDEETFGDEDFDEELDDGDDWDVSDEEDSDEDDEDDENDRKVDDWDEDWDDEEEDEEPAQKEKNKEAGQKTSKENCKKEKA